MSPRVEPALAGEGSSADSAAARMTDTQPNDPGAPARTGGHVPGQLAHLNEVRAAGCATRCAEAWDLRLDGWTVRRISVRLNVSVGTCAGYLRESLEELGRQSRESAEVWRQLELERLDRLVEVWLPRSQDANDVEAPRGAAIVVRVIEAQARLLGLLQPACTVVPAVENGPAKISWTPEMIDAVQAQLDRARGQLQTRAAIPATTDRPSIHSTYSGRPRMRRSAAPSAA